MTVEQTHASPRVAQRPFPLWLKIGLTVFIVVLVPVYWHHYGPSNFLWFSDIGLFGAAVALWTGSRLIASMMLLAAAVPDMVWNIDLLVALVSGWHPFGITAYMFDPAVPAYLRALSLFHLFLPPLLIWMVWTLGYDRRALAAQTLLTWVVLPLTYALTDPRKNINWAFGPHGGPQDAVAPWLYLLGVMLALPLLLYVPLHLIAMKLLVRRPR